MWNRSTVTSTITPKINVMISSNLESPNKLNLFTPQKEVIFIHDFLETRSINRSYKWRRNTFESSDQNELTDKAACDHQLEGWWEMIIILWSWLSMTKYMKLEGGLVWDIKISGVRFSYKGRLFLQFCLGGNLYSLSKKISFYYELNEFMSTYKINIVWHR